MMSKPMLKLRCRMLEKSVERSDCVKYLNCSEGYWTARIMGRSYFDMGDVYKLCKLLDIPYESISEYFPPMRA
jgi:hypothetical protein